MSVSALLSAGYITIRWPSLSKVTITVIHCVRFQISWELTGKADRWQDRRHTDWQWRAVSEDTRIIRYWLLHDTASIGRVTIPSNRADRPTLDQILNLRRTDLHTRPLPPTVLVRQSGSINASFQHVVLSARRACVAGKKRNKQCMHTNNAEKHNARISIRIGQIPSLHVLRFSAFFMCMRCVWQVGNWP